MTSGVKRFNVFELSPGTVSVDVAGTALPAGVTDEQRRDFYFFDKPVVLSGGQTVQPEQQSVSATKVEVAAELDYSAFLALPSE